ncbi:NAD(P)-dependent oxidoreductase [Agrococcus sp. SGAir0287]|uniref:NAD(P)-dependent oxidoreductase n=1 Tax=Agrococcus sp. SGAir0287 TaxID=2070347 RepID=UPI0010CCB82F|nr:NAD(P)-dependent oxidoreductase [Agrococcus sp. SGAir0287]QCR18105.1 NAD(P)-dependent oxidoreductase [Agrococcus sp. SGAir0287]
MRIAILGLGEAGALYASAAVAAGHTVTGFDPFAQTTPDGVERAASTGEAVAEADLVVALTAASLSEQVADESLQAMRAGATYADFTTADPAIMRAVAARAVQHDVAFADVAILGPVPVKGAATDVIVSGTGAESARTLLEELGASVELLDDEAGAATSHKLLRSILMKGLASVVLEAVAAGRAAGAEEWIRAQIARQLAGDGEATIRRFEVGTPKHAARRAHEMASVVRHLDGLGVPAEMSDATRRALERMTEAG